MKKFAIALATTAFIATPAFAGFNVDTPHLDSDDNQIFQQSVKTAPKASTGFLGSTFGGFGVKKNVNVNTNAIDSDDNQIYNIR